MELSDTKNATADRNWYILLAGLPRLPEPVQLSPGLTLRPLGSPLSVFDLAAAGAVGFREWAILEPIAHACTSEIESEKDAVTLPGYDTLNRAWLTSALLVLRGFSSHLPLACSRYSWSVIAGHTQRTSSILRNQQREESVDAPASNSRQTLPPFQGRLLDFHLRLLVNPGARVDGVGADDSTWISAHFNTFNRLASESASFRLGLEAAIDWRYAKEPREAVARLWSGIEALFGINSELVFRISLLGSSLLTPRGDQRKARFDDIKKLYGLRSKAVHGGQISEEKLLIAMGESYNLLRELLLLAIEKGHTLGTDDFEKALFY